MFSRRVLGAYFRRAIGWVVPRKLKFRRGLIGEAFRVAGGGRRWFSLHYDVALCYDLEAEGDKGFCFLIKKIYFHQSSDCTV